MPTWTEDLPEWENEGVAPPSAKKTEGWLPEEKPPAGWFNWLFHRAYKCIEEIRDRLHLVSTTGSYTDLENVPSEFTPSTHTIGGTRHSADTLANLNSKISDATLDDVSGQRTPRTHGNEAHSSAYITDTQAHALGSAYHTADTLANVNSKISDATLDDVSGERTAVAHAIGGSRHTADTLANLNSKITDADLDAAGTARPPTAHNLGGAAHAADTLANLNSKITDADLDAAGTARPPTTHDNSAHDPNFATESDLTTHIGHVSSANNVHGLRDNKVILGVDSSGAGADTTVVGKGASASDNYGTAIGRYADSQGNNSTSIGPASKAIGALSTSLGHDAQATATEATAIGRNSRAPAQGSVSLGSASRAQSLGATALGWGADVSAGVSGIAIGASAFVDGMESIALGRIASAGSGLGNADFACALGAQTTCSHDYSVALGVGAQTTAANRGVLGGTGASRTNDWVVPGNFSVSGSKNFDITNPANPEEDLRHGAVESPDAQNMYRYTVEVEDEYTEKLPDWFMPLNKDPQVWVSPDRHFGRGYGYVEDGELKVVCDTPGAYNVLVIGSRNEKGQAGRAITKPKGLTWDGKTASIIDEEEEEVDGELVVVCKTYTAPEGECTKRSAAHYRGARVTVKDKQVRLSEKEYTHTARDMRKAKQLANDKAQKDKY